MKDITAKSTGFLVDEWITARFKLEVFPDNIEIITRIHQLGNAITVRVLGKDKSFDNKLFWKLVANLEDILRQCWNAQEIIRDYKNQCNDAIIKAAITAQETNGQRNALIRKIDALMGEEEITQLEKTYT